MIQAFVTGNLGKDAELKGVGDGYVCEFSVASSRKIKGKDEVTWVRCSIWGKRGSAVSQYLTKGTKVAVSGEFSAREHNGKTYLQLRVSEIEMMGGRRGSQSRDEPRAADPSDFDTGGGDDDIPF